MDTFSRIEISLNMSCFLGLLIAVSPMAIFSKVYFLHLPVENMGSYFFLGLVVFRQKRACAVCPQENVEA